MTDGRLERTEIECIMIAAWNGVDPKNMPDSMRMHANSETAKAWRRVYNAVMDFERKQDE